MLQESLATRIALLAETWPPIISAEELPRLLGGLYTKKTLANMRWQGTGPRAFKIGRKVFHLRQDVVDWLLAKARPFDPDAIE